MAGVSHELRTYLTILRYGAMLQPTDRWYLMPKTNRRFNGFSSLYITHSSLTALHRPIRPSLVARNRVYCRASTLF